MRIFLDILPGEFDAVLTSVYQFCCEHTSPKFVEPILAITWEYIQKNLHEPERTRIYLQCLNTVISTKQGRLVKDTRKLLDLLRDLIGKDCRTEECLECVMSVIEAEKIPKTEDQVSEAVGLVMEHGFSLEQKMRFVSEFQDESVFDSFLMKPYLGWIQRAAAENYDSLSSHLSSVLLERSPVCQLGADLRTVQRFTLDLQLVPSLRRFKKQELFPNLAIQRLDKKESVETIRNSLLICTSVRPIDTDKVLERISVLIRHVLEEKDLSKLPILPMAIQTVTFLSSPTKVIDYFDSEKIAELFLESTDKDILQVLNFALTAESWSETCRLSPETLEQILTRLVSFLSDPGSTVRLLALHSLSLVLPQLGAQYSAPPEENYLSVLEVVETMMEAERTPETLAEYKKKMSLLQRIEAERLHQTIRFVARVEI